MSAPGESGARVPPAESGAAGERGPDPQVLLALAAAGLLAFNFPLLMVWDADVTVFGLPLLPVALFAIWAALIAALAFVSERRAAPVDVLAAQMVAQAAASATTQATAQAAARETARRSAADEAPAAPPPRSGDAS